MFDDDEEEEEEERENHETGSSKGALRTLDAVGPGLHMHAKKLLYLKKPDHVLVE